MELELSFNERRVLGVLMEKAFTTPNAYPLSLNSLVTGCNQKSCRAPVASLGEEDVLDALDQLRDKGLSSVVHTAGGRTERWRHRAADTLDLSGGPAAVMAELFLRGPQTDGELRQNAKRMTRIDSLDALQEVIDALRRREPPLVIKLGPEERRRGVRYAHTLYPAEELERIRSQEALAPETPEPPPPAAAPPAIREPSENVENLREEIRELRMEMLELAERVRKLEDGAGG